ncbi:hypothetical protein HR15_07015 [Porphyromonas gulae]|uniref:Uncharacterized protein n=1 Tax=Porphyromonas gulae TaxID=111105 RepID=A0A0A2FAJ6_9PORP|nr:hypothetical protein HR15_07015 [Porphyromonas gulae]
MFLYHPAKGAKGEIRAMVLAAEMPLFGGESASWGENVEFPPDNLHFGHEICPRKLRDDKFAPK